MLQMIPARARIAVVLCAALAVSACGKKDAAPADSGSSSSPPASTGPLRVTDIQLGKSIGSDRRIASPATSFGVRDTIYVSVITDGTASDARLTASWMYNGTQGISEADEMLTSAGGTNVSEFHISKDTPWPVGAYTVEVKLDGVSAGKREFRVQ